ncbi:MAG: RNA 2',3'-cyclic phosphodiesterase [Chloroflexales bacterium]|nr:RNA 2',3'-cyclic phosphodiesterase [Chloroflexales bacterium]
MRLFIALDLPEPLRAELAAAQARLRGHPVRWSEPAGIHLTLQFLGETDQALVAPLLEALSAIAVAPLTLVLAGLGAFPSTRQPHVIWVGVGGDTQALARLQSAVAAATAPLGFIPERRAFTAHLTLGRARQEASPEQLRALGEALARIQPPAPLIWEATRPILFQSILTPRGATYTQLG